MYNPPFGDDLGFTFVGAYTPPDGGGVSFNFITEAPSPVLARADAYVPFSIAAESIGEVRGVGQPYLTISASAEGVAPPVGVVVVTVTPVIVASGAGEVRGVSAPYLTFSVAGVGGTRTVADVAITLPFVPSIIGAVRVTAPVAFDVPFVFTTQVVGEVRGTVSNGIPISVSAGAIGEVRGVVNTTTQIFASVQGAGAVVGYSATAIPVIASATGGARVTASAAISFPFYSHTVGAGIVSGAVDTSVPYVIDKTYGIDAAGGDLIASLRFNVSANGSSNSGVGDIVLGTFVRGDPVLGFSVTGAAGRVAEFSQAIPYDFSAEGHTQVTSQSVFEAPISVFVEGCGGFVVGVGQVLSPFETAAEAGVSVIGESQFDSFLMVEAYISPSTVGDCALGIPYEVSVTDYGSSAGAASFYIGAQVTAMSFFGAGGQSDAGVPIGAVISGGVGVCGRAAGEFSFAARAAGVRGVSAVCSVQSPFVATGDMRHSVAVTGALSFDMPIPVASIGATKNHLSEALVNSVPVSSTHTKVFVQC